MTAKAPTRRQIAAKTLETIRVLNHNSRTMDALHARLMLNHNSRTMDALHDRLTKVEDWQRQEQTITGWQRVKRVFGR